ncbi:MAG: peptidyl-prolyl cis-trans isomerase, partial [Lachnospiraceae bacterium]|nr:peptidyl-prolyl cis-trans isomerase [Lachnospiraceae bacterium]
EEVRTAADELADGECSTIIETDSGYYIVQMVSTFDREATDSRKEAIVQERKNALYDEKYAELAEAHSFTVNDETAAKLTFERTYTLKTEE